MLELAINYCETCGFRINEWHFFRRIESDIRSLRRIHLLQNLSISKASCMKIRKLSHFKSCSLTAEMPFAEVCLSRFALSMGRAAFRSQTGCGCFPICLRACLYLSNTSSNRVAAVAVKWYRACPRRYKMILDTAVYLILTPQSPLKNNKFYWEIDRIDSNWADSATSASYIINIA